MIGMICALNRLVHASGVRWWNTGLLIQRARVRISFAILSRLFSSFFLSTTPQFTELYK